MPDPYKADRKKYRTVRTIKPLPRSMHPEFHRFCADLAEWARNQRDTFTQERIGYDNDIIITLHEYYAHVVKFLNHLEYLGTNNASERNPRGR